MQTLVKPTHWARSLKWLGVGLGPMTLLTSCPPSPRPPEPPQTCMITLQGWANIEKPEYSVACVWDELALESIRNVLPQPTAHARNLFHLSAPLAAPLPRC